MVASGAVCGDAFPGNGLPVRGLWSLIPVLVAFPLILCQQPPVTDRLPRHSIRISSNRGLYCILMWLLVEMMGFSDMIIKILSNILVIIFNYVASKFWIFKKKGQ